MANILLCKGIGMMGNAVGFPLCVGLGMVTGAVVAYVSEQKSDPFFLVPGIFVALCGIFTVGFLSHRREQETVKDNDLECSSLASQSVTEVSMVRKLLVCIVGGLLLGFSNIGVLRATQGEHCRLSPYANQTYFSVGVFLSSVLLVPLITTFPIEGGRGASFISVLRQYPTYRLADHGLAALGGFILCSGFFFFNLGTKPLGVTVAYCIGQSAPLVGILWAPSFSKSLRVRARESGALCPLSASFLGLPLLSWPRQAEDIDEPRIEYCMTSIGYTWCL